MLNLIDTHCHLDFDVFADDRQHVLQQCAESGVTEIVVPATLAQNFDHTIACVKQSAANSPVRLHLALGLHPIFIEQHQADHLVTLDDYLGKHTPLAVGEIGLDFFDANVSTPALREKQQAFFTKQLIIAKRHQLPVIIHNRKAHDLCLQLLAEIKVCGGIVHAFNGSQQQAEKYIALGFKLGFGGMLTYARSRKLRRLAQQLPLESLVLETDAPDMTVSQHQGQRNSPAYLPLVLQALAEIRQVPTNQVALATTQNAHNVLSIS